MLLCPFRIAIHEEIPGDLAGGATPVPIPNTEVKSSRADGTAAVRLWESRTLPGSLESPSIERSMGFFYAKRLLNLVVRI